MCICSPEIKTPWCGKQGCEIPEQPKETKVVCPCGRKFTVQVWKKGEERKKCFSCSRFSNYLEVATDAMKYEVNCVLDKIQSAKDLTEMIYFIEHLREKYAR